MKKFNLPINFSKLAFLKKIRVSKKTLVPVLIVVAVIAIAIFGRKSPFGKNWNAVLPDPSIFDPTSGVVQDDNKYTAFFFDIYNLIKEKYWNKLSDEQINNVVKLAIEKITEQPVITPPTTQTELRTLLIKSMENKSDQEKKEFVVKLSDIVLANLEPFGRSRLYTSKKQQELTNTVKNINPEVNHYDELGVKKEATPEEVKIAYQTKLNELKSKPQTEEIKQNLAKLEKAYEVVGDTGNKKVYDQFSVDPTIINRLISPRIFYIHITKFSPTTVEELMRVMDKVDAGEELDTLIIDLRGNIGGAIDGLPYFLGPFIGNNQYAYQFFTRGEKVDFKTKTGWLASLVRYKKVVVLTDGQVQSSAEVFASVLKKYNVGILVGEKTKGWGTVESVYKITNQLDPENETYSVFLVHDLTLREDGVPIEGKGVEPAVNTALPNWERELNRYYNNPELLSAVKTLLKK